MTKRSTSEKILVGVFFVLFIGYAISLIYPFIWCLLNSFKSKQEFLFGNNIWGFPKEWYFQNWSDSFKLKANGLTIPEMYLNTIIFTFGCTFLSLASCSCTAYILTKYNFKGKNFFYSFALIIMMIPTMGSMASMYKIYKIHIYSTQK